MITNFTKELFSRARALNEQIKEDVKLLAGTQRCLTHERKRAAKRDGELVHAIHSEKTSEGKAVFSNPDTRNAELAIRVMIDEERSHLEGEIAELVIQREQHSAALEANRNELKIVMLEIRVALLDAGEQPYQPFNSEK